MSNETKVPRKPKPTTKKDPPLKTATVANAQPKAAPEAKAQPVKKAGPLRGGLPMLENCIDAMTGLPGYTNDHKKAIREGLLEQLTAGTILIEKIVKNADLQTYIGNLLKIKE